MEKRLNIFVDENGDFGFNDKSSDLYIVSFVFQEQNTEISEIINSFNARLERIGYTKMIHMADLVMKRGDYIKFDINKRIKIFKTIFYFTRKCPIKLYSIIINKTYTNNLATLKQQIDNNLKEMLQKNENYLKKFNKVVLYYDDGQTSLSDILINRFSIFEKFEQISNFDHEKERLFQVADMLTFIDKLDYKKKYKMYISKGEAYFFKKDEIRKTLKELAKKKLH